MAKIATEIMVKTNFRLHKIVDSKTKRCWYQVSTTYRADILLGDLKAHFGTDNKNGWHSWKFRNRKIATDLLMMAILKWG